MQLASIVAGGMKMSEEKQRELLIGAVIATMIDLGCYDGDEIRKLVQGLECTFGKYNEGYFSLMYDVFHKGEKE